MNNLQDQGRSCYKRGDYKKAIGLFDRAIGRSPSVQLLDNRAACYEKLGEFATALKDAKKAIQLHREDAVGYLRAGRVLVKMEKQSVALEIYTHGLKSIKHVGQGYEQLRKVHKELMSQLCPPKSVDPMTVLPRELAETILDYLSFRQLMNACLVSKQWTHFIRSIPNQWRHLDLSGARRKVRSAFISRVINTARTKLTAATLSNLYDFDKTVAALVKHCPLEELTLLKCGLQSQSLTTLLKPATSLRSLKIGEDTLLKSQELFYLISALSDRLETLECRVVGKQQPDAYHVRCEKLKCLTIDFGDSNCNHASFFPDLADHFPYLEALTVRQPYGTVSGNAPIMLQDCTKLHMLVFDVGLRDFNQLRLPPDLSSLTLNTLSIGGSRLPDFSLPCLTELCLLGGRISFAEIAHLLDISSAPDLGNEVPDNEIARPTALRRLTVWSGCCLNKQDAQWLFSHPRMKEVTDLKLLGCAGIDEVVVEAILSAKLEHLQNIELEGAALTGVGVKQLVSEHNLQFLSLKNCGSISLDAVEWARSKGVAVRWSMKDASAGGKKVRY